MRVKERCAGRVLIRCKDPEVRVGIEKFKRLAVASRCLLWDPSVPLGVCILPYCCKPLH